ncbi:unnamed protein product [Urochloa decumbens]|uniref:Myb/SANT-like domain-containing protein n=1 Tax=Urochloa decumbens TaxID=240449 RepID=A0ABC9G0I2_9POAL
MNPLRRPAAAARREPSPGGEINGSAASDLDPGVWSGDGSGSRAEQPRGGEAAGAAAPHGVAGAGGIGLQMAWPGGAPPSPSVLASLLPGGSASGVTAGVVPGGTAMADGGNVLDWWSSQASGQLGPEWLAAVLAAAGGDGFDIQPEPFTGWTSRGRRGDSSSRRPCSPTRWARWREADWCDENTRIVCELFAHEVQIGNRATTHLDKTGYQNMIKRFQDRTGLLYTRRQFKNRWDKLKNDYGIWKELMKETGLGWDESGKNIVMTDKWWKDTSKKIKGCTRFKNRGIQNEDELEIMFEDLRNTGDDHWCASSGVAPSQPSPPQSPIAVDDDDEAGIEENDSDPEEITPTSGRGKRGRAADNNKGTGKKAKTTTGQWFQEQMGKIVEMNERTTASCDSIARREDKSGSSIPDVMALVKECGAVPPTKEHFIACTLFTKRSERQMFMTIETPEERFDYLTKKHEWMTRNDVPK